MNNLLLVFIILWVFTISYFATTAYIASFKIATNRTASPEQVKQINKNTSDIKTLNALLNYMDEHGTKNYRDYINR